MATIRPNDSRTSPRRRAASLTLFHPASSIWYPESLCRTAATSPTTYDSVARLKGTWLKNSTNGTLNSHEYTYNPGNQRTQQVFNAGGTYNYTYDAIGQLAIADSGTASEDRGYAYDAAWNLNYRTNNGSVGTFTVDSKNQLTQDPLQLDSYDGNGNLVSRTGSESYTYDDENRLTDWVIGTTYKTAFVYDGLGRLRKRIEYTWNGISWNASTITTYVYDGMRVIQERNNSSVPQVSYTRGTDLSGSLEGAGGIGGLLARSHGYASSNGNFYTHNCYHADGNGNVTYLVNSSQTLAASYRYDPYGNTISSSGTLASANVYRFSSKEIHVNSGLYYYGYRWYAPNLQRWLNRDRLNEHGGINLYGYVANSPVNVLDPIGLCGWGLPHELAESDEDYKAAWYKEASKGAAAFLAIPAALLAESALGLLGIGAVAAESATGVLGSSVTATETTVTIAGTGVYSSTVTAGTGYALAAGETTTATLGTSLVGGSTVSVIVATDVGFGAPVVILGTGGITSTGTTLGIAVGSVLIGNPNGN